MKFRHPDLQTRLHSDMTDILALQETRVLHDESRLAEYAGYDSKTQYPDGRYRASLYICKSIYPTVLNLAMFSTDAAEYAVVTVRAHSVDVAVVFLYVRPEVTSSCSGNRLKV